MTRDSPSFKDELDILKFICKDFWTKVFRRQVDNLRTNHQVQKNIRLEPKLQFRNASELKRNHNLSCTYSVCGQNSDPSCQFCTIAFYHFLGNWTFQWTRFESAKKIHFNKLSVPSVRRCSWIYNCSSNTQWALDQSFSTGHLCSSGQQIFTAHSALQWETVPGSSTEG